MEKSTWFPFSVTYVTSAIFKRGMSPGVEPEQDRTLLIGILDREVLDSFWSRAVPVLSYCALPLKIYSMWPIFNK